MGSTQSTFLSFCGSRGYHFGRENSLIKILPFGKERALGAWGGRRAVGRASGARGDAALMPPRSKRDVGGEGSL